MEVASKRALLLHGTDGAPDYNWFPWLKEQLEQDGYQVWAPALPDCHTPNKNRYESFLRQANWDYTNNLIIGHSSGATTALNLLTADWFPRVKKVILVGTFLNERLLPGVDWYEPGQFDHLFPTDDFNTATLLKKSDSFVFVHGDDDPYCALGDAIEFANEVEGEVVIVKGGGHLSSNRKELPEILPYIGVW